MITVNGEPLPESLVVEERISLQERYKGDPTQEKTEEEIEADALENAIERLLLRQEAQKTQPRPSVKDGQKELNRMKREAGGPKPFYEKYRLTPDDDDSVTEDLRDRLQLQHYMEAICADVAPPDMAEIQDFYDKNLPHFIDSEQIRASHILIQLEPGMDIGAVTMELLNLRQEIVAGANFAEVAIRTSHCEDQGGDLGWFRKGQMVPEFEEKAFALAVGEVSEPFQTQFGMHLVMVTDTQAERQVPVEEAKADIEQLLHQNLKNKRVGAVVDELLKTADVDRNVPDPVGADKTKPETTPETPTPKKPKRK